MIAGHITLEDHSLHFHAIRGGQVTYSVQDHSGGVGETLTVHGGAFAIALGIALHPGDGEGGTTQEQSDVAEGAMPLNPELRWIP